MRAGLYPLYINFKNLSAFASSEFSWLDMRMYSPSFDFEIIDEK